MIKFIGLVEGLVSTIFALNILTAAMQPPPRRPIAAMRDGTQTCGYRADVDF